MRNNKQLPYISKLQLIRVLIICAFLLLATLYVLQKQGMLRKNDLIVLGISLPLLTLIVLMGMKLSWAAFRQKEPWAIRTLSGIIKIFVVLSIGALIAKFFVK